MYDGAAPLPPFHQLYCLYSSISSVPSRATLSLEGSKFCTKPFLFLMATIQPLSGSRVD